MTWNAEGLKTSIFMIKDCLYQHKISLCFISESQTFQSDISGLMEHLQSDYCYFLNSEDYYDPELALTKNTTPGGTLVIWRNNLDPYISLHPVHTPSFTPIVLKIPGCQITVHIALYLPTQGRDADFVADLADLRVCLEELRTTYPDCLIFIRGDSNVNQKNKTRVSLFKQFMSDFSLRRVDITHNTYHHFVGDGLFDSNIDVILHTDVEQIEEKVTKIICKHENPLVLSHHDIVLSAVSIPVQPVITQHTQLVTAPRIVSVREKITWSEDGASQYEQRVSPQLQWIRDVWLHSSSQACMSVLLKLTNFVLSSTASRTNKAVSLVSKTRRRPAPTPPAVISAKKQLTRAHKKLKASKSCLSSEENFKKAQKEYKQAVRVARVKAGTRRDQQIFSIMTSNPTALFNYIRSSKNSSSTAIQKLSVAGTEYVGDKVPDGFYASMTSLKSCNIERLEECPDLADKFINYKHIMKLCENQPKIPQISRKKAAELLTRIKKKVKDFYSITVLHYLNAGVAGLDHFHETLNAIIENENNAEIEELNTAHGLILFKGHKKNKESDRSYRTISSCPFLSKALDLYLRDLYHELWDACQAPTQYQGTGSSHELASLLITEVIQHSLYVKNQPVYLLSLDAQSAFDRCLRQVLVNELYRAGVAGAAITIIDKRLENRATVYDWNGTLMGPGIDITGFEQGGVNSSDFYKLYNNEQLRTAQASGLGVDMGSSIVSAVGQADDVILVSNDIDSLALLVRLTEYYCAKYRVTLVPEKTKLLAFHTDSQEQLVNYARIVNPITVADKPILFSEEAEHVGLIRNTSGNMANIMNRIAAHKKALGAVLFSGMAQGHRGNPAASLRVQQVYGTGVLFSGLASLVMSPAEVKIIDQHFLKTVQNLQKLHDKTPRSFVLLMAGCLPGEAILHLKQLTLFSMLCHLPDDPLNLHGRSVLLSAPPTARSWFHQIQDISLKYSLDHPHHVLCHPPTRNVLKRKIKKAITTYWEEKLRQEASSMASLHLFLPYNCNLQHPHPLWLTAGSNSFECHKSVLVARMISGRFKSDYHSRHWTSNKLGHCLLDSCHEVKGDLEHLLITCQGLATIRGRMWDMIFGKTKKLIPLLNFVYKIAASPPFLQLQFFLEPLAFSELVELCSIYGQAILDTLYYCTRTYVYYIYREKQILLGKWQGDMTVVTRKNQKVLTFRKTKGHDNINGSILYNTNICSVTGAVMQPSVYQQMPQFPIAIAHQYPLASTSNIATAYSHAEMTGGGVGVGDLHGGSGHPTALDCPCGVVGCSCGGDVVSDCRSGQYLPVLTNQTNGVPVTGVEHAGGGRG